MAILAPTIGVHARPRRAACPPTAMTSLLRKKGPGASRGNRANRLGAWRKALRAPIKPVNLRGETGAMVFLRRSSLLGRQAFESSVCHLRRAIVEGPWVEGRVGIAGTSSVNEPSASPRARLSSEATASVRLLLEISPRKSGIGRESREGGDRRRAAASNCRCSKPLDLGFRRCLAEASRG